MEALRKMGPTVLCVATMVAACGGANEATLRTTSPRASAPGVTNAQPTDDPTVDRLVDARCRREDRCENIGAGRKFASVDACQHELRVSTAEDFNATECPRGLDRGGVELCLGAIQAEHCDRPLDTITRIGDCLSYHICLK